VVRPEVIRKLLNKLDEYLSILYSLRKYSFDDFASDPERYGSSELFCICPLRLSWTWVIM
jgi:hypothetical protein